MNIDISETERDVLLEVLEGNLKDMSIEVHRTDSLMYKHALEVRQHTIESLIARIKRPERQAMAA